MKDKKFWKLIYDVLHEREEIFRGVHIPRKKGDDSLNHDHYPFNPKHAMDIENIKKLDLSGRDIQGLSGEIEYLIYLQELDISDNYIGTLPPEIGRLTNLKKFAAYENDLKGLPVEMANMKSLKALDIGENLLREFPNVIFSLENLEMLHMSGNRISEVPPEIGCLKKLKYLNLCRCRITELPEKWGTWPIWRPFPFRGIPSLVYPMRCQDWIISGHCDWIGRAFVNFLKCFAIYQTLKMSMLNTISRIKLRWMTRHGITFDKSFYFSRNSYKEFNIFQKAVPYRR